jgi:osmotically-inducible protein OsmY
MRLHISAALLAAAGVALAAPTLASESSYMRDRNAAFDSKLHAPTDAIHAGGASASDDTLANDVAAAIAADPRLFGATATITAVDGRVSLSGSAESVAQATLAEQVARGVAGAHVSGTLDPLGG